MFVEYSEILTNAIKAEHNNKLRKTFIRRKGMKQENVGICIKNVK